jgi:hypothetical protein
LKQQKGGFMRRFVLWIAAILITFATGVGVDRLGWYFLAAPPATQVEPVVDLSFPAREVSFSQTAALPPPLPVPLAPEPNLVLDFDPEKFSVWAVFYIMGPKSKHFAEINSLEVMLDPEVKESSAISVNTLDDNQYDNAQANFGLVTERRLFFTTDKLSDGDFAYRFDGEFLRTDFDVIAGKKKAVLRGTLTKMKNGRTIAHEEFTFRMEYMGC